LAKAPLKEEFSLRGRLPGVGEEKVCEKGGGAILGGGGGWAKRTSYFSGKKGERGLKHFE